MKNQMRSAARSVCQAEYKSETMEKRRIIPQSAIRNPHSMGFTGQAGFHNAHDNR